MASLFVPGKIVQFLISPLNLVLLLILLAWLLRKLRPVWSSRLLLTSLLMLYLASNGLVTHFLLLGLERVHEPPTLSSVEKREALVLLGGTVFPSIPPRHEAEELVGGRAQKAVRIFKAGLAPLVIVSGGGPYVLPDGTTRTEADDMHDLLVDMGVPANAIVMENRSRNTDENARFTAEILKERKIESVILVTSAIHMPRAGALFEREGVDVVPVASDPRAVETPWTWQNLRPSPDNLRFTTLALNEYVGYWGYRLMGRL